MSKRFSGAMMGAAAGFFFMGGPVGAIIGGMLGNMLSSDDDEAENYRSRGNQGFGGGPGTTTQVPPRARELVFVSSLAALLTSVAKADGEIHQSELKAIQDLFSKNIRYSGHDYTLIQRMVKEFSGKKLDLRGICSETKRAVTYPELLMVLRMLYTVAMADNVFKESEKIRIQEIADYLNISQADHDFVKKEFSITDTGNDYSLLGLESSASDKEVKSAYRELVRKFHPDKVQHLGEEFVVIAKDKFQKIQNAYDKITKERGL